MRRTVALLALLLTVTLVAAPRQGPQSGVGAQLPPRDALGPQKNVPATGTARITGRITATDTGRAIKGARVFATAKELPDGRGVLTDAAGLFDMTELPAGHYTLTASKSGFLTLAYGQRRPLQSGVPLDVADRQQLTGIDFHLPHGSAIEGRIEDEDGYPLAGLMVRAMRYQYAQGARRLTPAGSAQTDDEGHYRIFGLVPGEYYINAIARLNLGGLGGAPGMPSLGRGFDVMSLLTTAITQVAGPNVASLISDGNEPDPVYLAPAYYPGVPSPAEASVIKLGLGEQAHDINFLVQLVRTSRITGHVMASDGGPITSGPVQLTPAGDPLATRTQLGDNFGGRIRSDGTFAINNVLPGSYMLRAQTDNSKPPQFAAQPVTLNGQDVPNLVVVVSPGATVSGTISFQGAASPPNLAQVVVTVPPTDQTVFPPVARPDKDGHFTVLNVPAGPHLIRANGSSDAWTLKSVTLGGNDVTDTPFELHSREDAADVAVVFTDAVTEINGTVTGPQGTPVADYTVLAFTTNQSLWRPQSRLIMTARPDQNGKYRIRGLPAGEYFLVTVDPTEQGEWFDPRYLEAHRANAIRLKVNDGDAKTQDWKVSVP